jgi:transcriptional regulator with XRE-family HTH domain
LTISLLIRHRLAKLRLDQKDLAAAAQVTESYISQLLAGKKAPPSPKRTDIYEKIGKVLKLPRAELAKLADLERSEELRKRVSAVPRPLFKECREMIIRKCDLPRRNDVRRIFEKEPFGELERLVTQKLLDFT